MFADNGYVVQGLDMRGHGYTYEKQAETKKANVVRGHATFDMMYKDLVELTLVDEVAQYKHLPTFLFGSSMGSEIALGRQEVSNL